MKNYDITISNSNSKTGCSSFNLLAGSNAHSYNGYTPKNLKEKAAACKGTCSVDCGGCYAKKLTRYPAVFESYYNNTRAVADGRFEDIKKVINNYVKNNAVKYFRIHDSGDFATLEYFKMWLEIAAENSETIFYTYTKRTDILRAAGFDSYDKLQAAAPNLTIQLSYWQGVCEDMLEGYPRFEYDDNSSEEIAQLHHCPAVAADGSRTGITCMQCKRCMLAKSGSKWAVYAH